MTPNILLINPPIYDFAAYDFWLKPYGLLSVAGYLRGQADFALFDYLDRLHPYFDENPLQSDQWGRGRFHQQQIAPPSCLEQIPRRYHRFGLPRQVFTAFLAKTTPPDYVLIQTTMTYWYQGVAEAIEDIRKFHPKAKIVLGGSYVTLCPDHAATLNADLCIEGTNLAPLWNRLALEPDLNQPALWEAYKKLNVGILKLTDGCPFKCTYCSVPKTYAKFSTRPIDRALAELNLLSKLGAKNIAFYDDALLFKPKKALTPFLEKIISQNATPPHPVIAKERSDCGNLQPLSGKGWQPQAKLAHGNNAIPTPNPQSPKTSHVIPSPAEESIQKDPRSGSTTQTKMTPKTPNFHSPNALNARFLTKEIAQLMVRAGFKTFYLGFESASTEWQNQTGSKVSSQELTAAVNHLKTAGADPQNITAYQILGHPQTDTQQLEKSMRFVNSLGIRGMLADFSPIPGTHDGDKCKKWIDMTDPLNHNKTAFPITLLGFKKTNRLKNLQRKLNRALSE